MEVHHHAHTADPGIHRGRKKWTHYLWEFLMLFLAVFCGFLAEYQREHMVEDQRAKEFASLMLEDLKKDTSYFRKGIKQFEMIEKHQDSLALILRSSFENINQYELTKHWINSIWPLSFIPHQATFEQMKQSGSLRYIKNIQVINSMQDYNYSLLPEIYHYHAIQSEFTEQRVVPFVEDHISYQQADFLTGTMNTSTPEIFNWNKGTSIKLYNMMELLRGQNRTLHQFYKIASEKAEIVMLSLKNEYHLK
jgi:hypothetical protein